MNKRLIFLFIVSCMLNFSISGQITVWQQEAETGELLGTSDVAQGCSNASGMAFVRILSDAGNGVRFNNISISKAGTYQLRIAYFHVNIQPLEIIINNTSMGAQNFPAGVWCYQGAASIFNIDVELVEGINTIELKAINGTAGPYIDKLILISTENTNPDISHRKTYYVSSTTGNDANTGTDAANAWKTIEKVNTSLFYQGDSILFKSGDIFIGQLRINSSGTPEYPVFYGKYGTGNFPVINGSTVEGGDHLCAIYINNESNIHLKNIEATNDRKVSRSGVSDVESYAIYVHNNGNDVMRNIHFEDLIIRKVFAVNTDGIEFDAMKVHGIRFYSERNTIAGKEKNIRDVLVENCYITLTGKFGIVGGHGGGDTGIGNDSINRNMNFVFRNNHTYHTGGSGIMPGGTYNCLLEHNTFENTGSNVDPRMVARGSGAWFFNSRNIIAQFNRSLHVRGPADSYGMHIDFNNRNVILQYNYSEDSQGGFVEILGNNYNSVYRFNVSVNDGLRDNSRSIWVSPYAYSPSTNNKINSEGNYVYNNSIYVTNGLTPDIYVEGKNTYIFNNIFYADGTAVIGQTVDVKIEAGSYLYVSNNLYYGNVRSALTSKDAAPKFGNPLFANKGALDPDGYKLSINSPALIGGMIIEEPPFPEAGKGIFKDISEFPSKDMFGNDVSLSTQLPNIGAYNGNPAQETSIDDLAANDNNKLMIFPMPVYNNLMFTFTSQYNNKSKIEIQNLEGKTIYTEMADFIVGENKHSITIDKNFTNGFYILSINNPEVSVSKKFVVVK
ncbi:MAG: T9SS type A sorting domain-containing protein [Bacteroidales bacterium]|jgi:hypothetical protein